jgi:hypothetical protein
MLYTITQENFDQSTSNRVTYSGDASILHISYIIWGQKPSLSINLKKRQGLRKDQQKTNDNT